MKQKKGQGLSMTTIVIAALALLVLVVLTLIFTNRMGLFNLGLGVTEDCTSYCDALGKTATTAEVGECSGQAVSNIQDGKCCCVTKVATPAES